MGKWTPSMGSQNLSSKLMYSQSTRREVQKVRWGQTTTIQISAVFFLSRNYYLALVTNTEFKVLESSNGLETNMCQLLQKAL